MQQIYSFLKILTTKRERALGALDGTLIRNPQCFSQNSLLSLSVTDCHYLSLPVTIFHYLSLSVTRLLTRFPPVGRGRLRRVDAPVVNWRGKCFGEVKTVFFEVLGRGSRTRFTSICCFESLKTIGRFFR